MNEVEKKLFEQLAQSIFNELNKNVENILCEYYSQKPLTEFPDLKKILENDINP